LNTTFIYKSKELSKFSLLSKRNATVKHHNIKMAIKKIKFPIYLQDNMDLYLKSTEKMATLMTSILHREPLPKNVCTTTRK